MYHTVIPSQMVVQIMNGQQTGEQCSPAQTHTMHINGINALHQTDFSQYSPDISGHGRHRMMQMSSHYHPLDLLLTGVDVPSLRPVGYMQSNNNSSSANWNRKTSSACNNTSIPPSNYNFKSTCANTMKKQNWNKSDRRNSYKNSFSNYETYNSDSGFSSRSPTPSKHHIDNSLTESSDERDSMSSVGRRGIKKNFKVHSGNNTAPNNDLISRTSAQQFYQSQRPINYYHTTISTPRSHTPNYYNRRKYLPGRNSPPSSIPRPPKNRKFTGVLLPNYNVLPKYYIAPDRFLARSHLVEVTATPDNLITGSMWDNLSQHIWSKFKSSQQTETTYKNKMMLWKYLYIHIKTLYPKYGLFLVGSTLNGFGLDNSDVDMCLLVRHTEPDKKNERDEAVEHLQQILKCLKKCDFIEQLELIHAKVPIIRFRDSVQNLKVDINCNNDVGIRNTHLLYCYSKLDWRVRPLVLIVKLWAQCQDINDAKNMTISSYSLALMVIHFLQCGVSPPVLPCLQYWFSEKFCQDIHNIDIPSIDNEEFKLPPFFRYPENRQSLGELLVGFFKYYVTFNFRKYAISVRLANRLHIDLCRKARSYKNDPHQWKYLCIEEPFDQTNTARSVYDPDVFARIMQIFKITLIRLKTSRDLNCIFEKIDPISPNIT